MENLIHYTQYFKFPDKYPEKDIPVRFNKAITNLGIMVGKYPLPFSNPTTLPYNHPFNKPINSKYSTLLRYIGDTINVKVMWFYTLDKNNPHKKYRSVRLVGSKLCVKLMELILNWVFYCLHFIPSQQEKEILGLLEISALKNFKYLYNKDLIDYKGIYKLERWILEEISLDYKKYHAFSKSYNHVTSKVFFHKRMVN
jgi:hypothetical protein